MQLLALNALPGYQDLRGRQNIIYSLCQAVNRSHIEDDPRERVELSPTDVSLYCEISCDKPSYSEVCPPPPHPFVSTRHSSRFLYRHHTLVAWLCPV